MSERERPALTGPASRTKANEDGEQLDHMLVEVSLGVRKRDSRYIHSEADGRMWDELAASVAAQKALGIAIAFDDRD